MRIAAAVFKDFPPFADGYIRFPAENAENSTDQIGEVHILTGQNGTGKTRLLCLLAAALGNDWALNTRYEPSKSGVVTVLGRSTRWPHDFFWSPGKTGISGLRVPLTDDQLKQICSTGNSAEWQQGDFGNFLNLQKQYGPGAGLAFRGTANVTDVDISALAPINLGKVSHHLTFHENDPKVICQSMANLKILAAMDSLKAGTSKHSRSVRLMEKLEESISRITGRSFAFNVVPNPQVHLEVSWGKATGMKLKQLPDGLRSIIGWLVSCVAKLEAMFPELDDPLSVPLILLLDEPEGHLHPAWQRMILPAAQALFPQAQIFVATHSPFVISSVNRGWIHIFRADEAGIVTIQPPQACSAGDSYLDVIEDILGVKEWYDPETETLLEQFRSLRDAVLNGTASFDLLEDHALNIAKRSPSLHEMMAREMHQAKRILSSREVVPVVQ
jgi:energy-coupling factor transporter ATP-binding protein EcfA2